MRRVSVFRRPTIHDVRNSAGGGALNFPAFDPGESALVVPQTPLNRNIEIKARANSLEELEHAVVQLGAQPAGRLVQSDTYFQVRSGRLKLREFDDQPAEMIWYERPNALGPKTSNYLRVPILHPDALKQAISVAWGILAVVAKRRNVYLWKNVRIHLDEVENLGNFLEMEAVLNPGQDAQLGHEQIQWLCKRLRIASSDFLSYSYVDLFTKAQGCDR